MHVLIIEDDRDAAGYMAKGLKESGHNVEVVHSGKEGLLLAAGADYDVLIVDRMLPELDGLSLVKTLRATGNQTPVLFVSALGEVDERVKGLRSGGDDYLAKPYAFSELLARLESVARRRGAAPSAVPETVLRYHDLSLDLLARRVMRGGRPIDLQPREFKLLEVLMRHAGPGDDPDHAAREGLGLPLRSADQRHRRAHQPAAAEGRPRLRPPADPDGPRRRIQPACSGPGRLRPPPSG